MISVVIPLYNKASSIARTIEGVLLQTFSDYEVIVVDDGSTDSSAQTLLSFSDDRIRLIRKENGGVCSARNVGIKEARYEYVAFLDADDIWDKDYLLEQTRMIRDFPEAYMWGLNFAEISDGKQVRTLETGLPSGFRGIVENYFGIQGRVSDLFCSSSVVVRKAAFEKAGLFDERLKYSEDIDMWYRIIANFPVAFNDAYYAFYMFDAENRAMLRKQDMRCFMPYRCAKYKEYKGNEPFYSYVERWCAIKIKDYYFRQKDQRKYALEASKDLDYSVLPAKYKLFFKAPYPIAYLVWAITEAIHKMR